MTESLTMQAERGEDIRKPALTVLKQARYMPECQVRDALEASLIYLLAQSIEEDETW